MVYCVVDVDIKMVVNIDYTGMDKTSLAPAMRVYLLGSRGLRMYHGVHVTSNVITYPCSAGRRRGTIERRLT